MGYEKNILLLNSVHGKYPRGGDPWVGATVNALEELAGPGLRVIASTGLPSWELPAFLAGRLGLPVLLVLPRPEPDSPSSLIESLAADLGLDPGRVRLAFTGPGDRRSLMRARDSLAFELADTVYPVSVRPGGRLESLPRGGQTRRRSIDSRYAIEFAAVSGHPRPDIEGRGLSREALSLDPSSWLFHWTHSSPGRLAHERSCDFYRDLLARPDIFVRDARSCLIRIVREGILRGSTWKMPGKRSAVSFTAATPEEAAAMMRWRQRYSRYTFEPWGLALRKRALESLGARPVRYVEKGSAVPRSADRLFVQSAGKRADWRPEKEWRLPGDLALGSLRANDMILVVSGAEDTALLERDRAVHRRVISLFAG